MSSKRTKLIILVLLGALAVAAAWYHSTLDIVAEGRLPQPSIDVMKLVENASPLPSMTLKGWPWKSYSKVIGFHFKGPERWGEFSVLDTQKTINICRLQACAHAGEGLNTHEVTQLLKAVAGTTRKSLSGPCYEPNHVFVFYNKLNEPVAAIEVCFGCHAIEIRPELEVAIGYTAQPPDYDAVAHIVWDLGIWGSPRSSFSQYLSENKDRINADSPISK